MYHTAEKGSHSNSNNLASFFKYYFKLLWILKHLLYIRIWFGFGVRFGVWFVLGFLHN